MTLDNIGMSMLWNTCETTSHDAGLNFLPNAVYPIYMPKNLSSAIYENSQCITYRIFKQTLNFAKYLIDIPKKERIVLCRFRLSNHIYQLSPEDIKIFLGI